MKLWMQCPDCKGLGKVDGKRCPACEGRLGVEVTDEKKAETILKGER